MTSQWWTDDDTLLAALREADRAARAVPREFVEAGKAAFTWFDIDAELAALTYDSALEADKEPALTRDEPAPLRSLTFASAELTIELEVTTDALLGQIVPPQPGEIELRDAAGRTLIVLVDEIGCLTIRPIPSSSFRLHLRTNGGARVLTGWITL